MLANKQSVSMQSKVITEIYIYFFLLVSIPQKLVSNIQPWVNKAAVSPPIDQRADSKH